MLHYLLEQNTKKQPTINAKPLNVINIFMCMFFQGTATLTSISESRVSYYFQMHIFDSLHAFLSFQVQSDLSFIKFRFKPIHLISSNLPLVVNSLRSIFNLRCQLQFLNKQQKFSRLKWYINQKGQIFIELNCSQDQFFQLYNVSFILRTVFSEVSDLLGHIIPHIVSYLNLESILSSSSLKNQDSDSEEEVPSIVQKFKYMSLLNKVYKRHRKNSQIQQQSRKINENKFPKSQTFTRTNNLIQSDTSYIEQMEKEKEMFDTRFKPIFELFFCRNENKRDYLKMPKMRKVQNEFEEYVASIKKQHLQMDQMTNNQYRILKGIQNYQAIKPPKILSKNGAHSIIFLGRYKLHLSDTLFSYQHIQMNQYQAELRHIEQSLITKKISKVQHKAAVNSFRNEIDFLYHVKDKRSKFIATYFLPVERKKQEIEQIFSRHYKFNLKQYLENKKQSNRTQIELKEVLGIAQNILFSLAFLVDNFVLHRDLKPQNIVIDENQQARLIDFGSCSPIIYCNEFKVTSDKLLTTPAYQIKYNNCSDEITTKYSKQQYERHYMYDIHSFGQTFREIIEYLNIHSFKCSQQVDIPAVIQMIVDQCKDQDPMERITYDELLFYMKLLKELITKK